MASPGSGRSYHSVRTNNITKIMRYTKPETAENRLGIVVMALILAAFIWMGVEIFEHFIK